MELFLKHRGIDFDYIPKKDETVYLRENSNYAIIELNFNPAIHIHSYPYIGFEREM